MNSIKTLIAMAGLALATALPAAPVQAQATIEVLDESFDDISTLAPNWALINASTPLGQSWFQGNPGIFRSNSGAANSYIAADFLSARNGNGLVDNWLITPTIELMGASTLSFLTRGAVAAGYNDTLEVRFSPGSGTALSGFSTLLLTVGGVNDYPNSWDRLLATFDYDGSGRFAFRYLGDASASNYIGIDTVLVTTVPEPGAVLMLLAGLGTLALLRRRERGLTDPKETHHV